MITGKKDTEGTSLVEQTQRRVLEYISDHNYDFNTVLPKEDEMANILNVSRVVIREAYSGLRTLGFLETKRKKGTVFVAPKLFAILQYVMMSGFLDRQSIEDLYELRLMLEIGMADYVMANRSEDRLLLLQHIVDREEKTEDDDTLRKLDIEFHSTLYEMSGNKSLQHFEHLLSKLFTLYTPRMPDWQMTELMPHRALLEILRMGRPDLFRSAMRIHLENQFANQQKNISLFLQMNEKKG